MNFTTMSSFSSESREAKKKCPICGKMFKAAPEHAYSIGKNKKRLVCSYGCMRKYEKEKYEKQLNPSAVSIGKKIRAERQARGLNLQQFANKTKKSKNTLERIERGENMPHIKTLEAIAEALGVSVDYFGEVQK